MRQWLPLPQCQLCPCCVLFLPFPCEFISFVIHLPEMSPKLLFHIFVVPLSCPAKRDGIYAQSRLGDSPPAQFQVCYAVGAARGSPNPIPTSSGCCEAILHFVSNVHENPNISQIIISPFSWTFPMRSFQLTNQPCFMK